jgi:organic radical activating enzyme
MNPRIVAIKPINGHRMKITLQLTTACTYSCRYCPDRLNKGSHGEFDLAQLSKFFRKFKNREIILTITGGEATVHPQLQSILELAKKLNIKTQVDTNSVRTARFYTEIGQLADVWNITLHPSEHSLDLDKIRVLTDSSFVVVYVMMDPLHWDTAIDWWAQVTTLDNIKAIPLMTLSNYGGADCIIQYTEEQLTWLRETKPVLKFLKARQSELIKSHFWLVDADSRAFYTTGEVKTIDAYQLIKQGLNKFYNWDCYAGSENILINQDCSASWANCGIKHYAHFLDIDPAELGAPVVCDRLECTCVTDIRSSKETT